VKRCPIADKKLSNVRRYTITHLFKVVLRACPKTSNGKGEPSAIGTSGQIQLVCYLESEIIGAFLGSLFVKYTIGNKANLGDNAPNYAFPIPIIFGIEVLATALLMAVILVVVYSKGLGGFSGIVIGGMVGWIFSF
jgi:glycerol uptake facilitator-like aquaporin